MERIPMRRDEKKRGEVGCFSLEGDFMSAVLETAE